MHPIDPLSGFLSRLLPARVLRRFRVERRRMPTPLVPPAQQGEGRPLAVFVQPDAAVLHVGGSIPNDLVDAVPMVSRIRAIPVDLSLDAVVASRGPRVDLVNCADPSRVLRTLRGAGNLLAGSRPVWRMRIIGDPEDHAGPAHAVFHLLARRGYAAFVWDKGKLRPRGFSDGDSWYYFLTNRHIQALPGDLIGSGIDANACRAA